MTETITEHIDVDVPIQQAYNQWTQFEDFPQFMTTVDEVRQITPELTHWRMHIAGQEQEFDAKITEQHPDERVAWNSVSDDVVHAGVVTFHQLGAQQTRVTLQLDYEPHGLKETVGSKVGIPDNNAKKDLGNFKEFIESQPAATGSWREDIAR